MPPGAVEYRRVAHSFTATIEHFGSSYVVVVPVAIARAMGAKGRVPVVVVVGEGEPFHGTLMPRRDGQYVLHLNARTRGGARTGRLAITLELADANRDVEIPDDLAAALRDARAREGWQALPPGKREHILQWIEEAAFEATRTKRIALAVEKALERAERILLRGEEQGRARRSSA